MDTMAAIMQRLDQGDQQISAGYWKKNSKGTSTRVSVSISQVLPFSIKRRVRFARRFCCITSGSSQCCRLCKPNHPPSLSLPFASADRHGRR